MRTSHSLSLIVFFYNVRSVFLSSHVKDTLFIATLLSLFGADHSLVPVDLSTPVFHLYRLLLRSSIIETCSIQFSAAKSMLDPDCQLLSSSLSMPVYQAEHAFILMLSDTWY